MMTNIIPLRTEVAKTLTAMIGIGEVIFGICLLIARQKRIWYSLQMIAFPILAISAIIANPDYLAHPFSPLTFHLALVTLSVLGFLIHKDFPTAKSCKRTK